jgi:hypothetical protein
MVREDTGDIGNKKLEKPKVSSTHSREIFKTQGDLSSSAFDVQWDEGDTSVKEAWLVDNAAETVESPGIWDPNAFAQQAPSSWKQTKEPKRIQDISSPLLDEPEPDQLRSNSDEEDWPFKSPCKMEEQKKKKKMTPKKDIDSDIESDDEGPLMTSNGDKMANTVTRTVSDDYDEDDDIEDDTEDDAGGDSKVKEKRRSTSQGSKSSKGSSSRRSKKKDSEPALPRRGRGGRPDAEEDEDAEQSPAKPARARRSSRSSRSQSDDGEELGVDSAGRPKKPKRKGTKSEVVGDEDEELPTGSFHKLAKDADKKRSTSKSRKSKNPSSAGSSGRRRRVKDKSMDASGHSGGDDDVDEFGEDDHEIELKGDDEGTPTGGRPGWRERRAQNLKAPGSGGRRPPSSARTQMRRASSERWNRAVEGMDDEEEEEEDPKKDLSRSAHNPKPVKRYNSGGMTRMSTGIGTASYHGMEGGGGRHRTPNRPRSRKAAQTPNSDTSGGSFGAEDYEYEMNLSGRSGRSLESIDDLEDFEHIDFQTPGMANYNAEVMELMQRANPEVTAHLEARVNHKRGAVNYDQNMPMITRQALMTRTASTMAQRQFVDQSSIDKRNMLVRSMSNSSMASNDDLSMSQHRQQFARAAPSRRPPPRTRSSGMAALSRSEHPQRVTEDPRRGVGRTRSGVSSNTFRQNQKPNRLLSVPRRADGTEVTGRKGPPEERRGNISRAQSMQATVGRKISPKKPARRVPKAVPTKVPTRTKEDEDDSSVSEDSDVDSEDEMATRSPLKPRRKTLIKKVAPMPAQKKTDKRNFVIKKNRAKLHSMIYESKMGVDMNDLLKQVQQGEVQRSPIKTLLMPSP